MRSFKYWIYQPYKFLIFVPLVVIETLICVPAVCITALFSPYYGSQIGAFWARVIQWLAPMRAKVSGRENAQKNQSYVIVANHQSSFDIVMIYANIGIDFRWIMKKELRHAPLIGYACYRLDNIFIDRSSKRASYESIQAAKKILKGGTSVVVFPEGTRSADGKLGKFKHGAFKLAFELGLPILPVTIKDTHKIMGKSFSTMMPGRAEMVIHKPVDTQEYIDRRDELIELIHNTIDSAL